MAATGSVPDYKQTLREIDENKGLHAVFGNIIAGLEELPSKQKLILQIVETRRRREAEERKREAANRAQRDRLGLAAAAAAAEEEEEEPEAAAEEAAAAAAADDQLEDEEPEPATTEEALGWAPQQPLPAVDLTPLDLPAPCPGDPASETAELLELLLAGRGGLFARLAADSPETADPVLRCLFGLVSYGDAPLAPLEQLTEYYRGTQPEEMGWVPQLADFLTSIKTLGWGPPASGGARKRSTGEAAAATTVPAAGTGGAAAAGAGGGAGAPARPRMQNLRCLLRLLVAVAGLQQQGRLDAGFGGQDEAAGKALLRALLALLLDPRLCAALYGEVRSALEAAMGPWDEAVWRRVNDDTALAAAEAGPSHRAAYGVIRAVQGDSPRVRTWQQCAALQLLRRVVPQGAAGGSGGAGGSRRGQSGPDMREMLSLLGAKPTAATASALLGTLRPRGGGREQQQQRPDLWRLLTIMQCVHIVVWNAAYDAADDKESGDLVMWCCTLFRSMEQRLKSSPLEMRAKVFLAEAVSVYETAGLE